MRKYCLRAGLVIFFLYILPCVSAQQLPRPLGFVNDFAGVLKPDDLQTIEKLVTGVKNKTGAEIAVVTVKTIAPYGSIEEFSLALVEEWGIGEKDEDNGVLFILSVAEREVRIEVGYGLEGAIPDSLAGRILDTAVIPSFRTDDFSEGLTEGSRAIAAVVAKEYGISLAELDLPESYGDFDSVAVNFRSYLIVIIFFLAPILFFILLVILIYRFAKKRGLNNQGSSGFGSRYSSGRSSGRSSGSSSRGFSGGRSGGGGASRRF